MIEVDKVVAIVGANGSGINNATKSVVNALKVLSWELYQPIRMLPQTLTPGKPIHILSESALLIPIRKTNRLFAATIGRMNAAILYDIGRLFPWSP